MKISRGPVLDRFAELIDTSVDEVVEWVNCYVNHPDMATNPEPTEKDRLASIKAYIEMRISESSNQRIKASIAHAQRLAA